MKGGRGDVFIEKGLLDKIPGEKGPKGFAGKEGSIGWPGWLKKFITNFN